jgi:hypothetical protein
VTSPHRQHGIEEYLERKYMLISASTADEPIKAKIRRCGAPTVPSPVLRRQAFSTPSYFGEIVGKIPAGVREDCRSAGK